MEENHETEEEYSKSPQWMINENIMEILTIQKPGKGEHLWNGLEKIGSG